jgi:LCP family protein required for cell wall assembly
VKLLLGFVIGLAIGIGAEQLWHRRYDRGAARGPSVPGRRKRVALGVVASLVVVLVVLMVGTYAYAASQFAKIERVPVGGVLSGAPGGTNYLLVGTDNRPGVAGNRSDTMLVLRTEGKKSWIMSLPRDLYVTIPGQEGQHRINAAYNSGPETLIRTVQQTLGIPLDRYIEINFVSFAGLVDAIGGVTIDFPHPATDPKSGLDVQQTGPVELNGEQALAYVRSRTYTESIDGRQVVDGTADLGRVKRQQQFLRAVLSQAGESRNPFHLRKIGESLTAGLKIDDDMTLIDGIRFAWNMGRLDPESVVLPTTPTTTSGGAQVLLLNEQAAQPALQIFRG